MKTVTFNFERDEDFNEFVKEIKKIPEKAGFVEIESQDEIVIKITNLKED